MNGIVGYTTKRIRVSSLKPSPENPVIYRTTYGDPDLDKLTESIRTHGLQQQPVVTADNYIVSGHRRHAALTRLKKQWVTCRVMPKKRSDFTADEFARLLIAHNEQRHKSVAEQVREELVNIDPAEAHQRLCEQRDKSVNRVEYNGIQVVNIDGTKSRYAISDGKNEHVKQILKVVEGRRRYWPLSVRGVHYPLLNFPFVRGHYWPRKDQPDHGKRRTLWYKNDQGSYDATSNLITRLRLDGTIPWEAFDDFTRPLKEFFPFNDARQFARQQIDKLFVGYWRNLLQTQPDHIEVVCEKNTIYHMVLRVTEKYQIPTSSGRGFNSIDPWYDLSERFKNSGKERLVVITLADEDPEGEKITVVGGQTLRDEFDINDPEPIIIKAGVTREQIERYELASDNLAKEKSPNYQWFVEKNGGDDTVWELEALDPADMMADLEKVIRKVIDVDLYNREVEVEREEAAYLEAVRTSAIEKLRGLTE